MKKTNEFIYFFDAFSNGLTVPVLSMIYLSHGASLQTLSLFVSVFAITVIMAEVPSEMIADLLGRKKIFVLSHVVLLGCYILIFFCHSWFLLGIACILKGIGIAFTLGSLEALIVETFVEKNGETSLGKINGILLRHNCMGSALGALVGGVLGNIGSKYLALLAFKIGMEFILMSVAHLCITEDWKRTINRDYKQGIIHYNRSRRFTGKKYAS